MRLNTPGALEVGLSLTNWEEFAKKAEKGEALHELVDWIDQSFPAYSGNLDEISLDGIRTYI